MRRRFAFILVLVAFIGALAARRWGHGAFDVNELLGMLAGVRTRGWLLPVYLSLFGLTTFLAPAFVFFVVAGSVWGFWPGCLAGWLGATIWSQLHFLTGRLVGGQRVAQWLERRQVTGIRAELEHGGVLATLILRQLPLPFVGLNAAAGASPMKWWRFSVGNAFGLMPSALVYSWSAASIVAGVEGARTEALLRILGAAVVMAIVGLVSRGVHRRITSGARI